MKSDVKIDGNRLRITRIFEAPREVVFGWWADAQKLAKWSGCKDATKCEIEMDFRVGGGFTQKMQIAGAGEFTLTGAYDEIVVPERIAYHAKLGPNATTRVVVEFFDEAGRTKVVLTQDGFPDEFHCKMVSQGTGESFDKLEAVLTPVSVAK